MARMTLGEIARFLGADLRGDADTEIHGIATLASAGPGDISFLANPRYRAQLAGTAAGAVLVRADVAADCPCAAVICDDPYLAYARLSHLFETRRPVAEGVHPQAVIAEDAVLGEGVRIAPFVTIGSGVVVGDGVEIGPGCVVGDDCRIGPGSRLAANVTLYHNVTLGARCTIHSGTVIGSDGFGYAPLNPGWQKIAQIGGVKVGDDVEIGANTAIDGGALEPTRIGNGVIIDNQVHIAHNCEIGDHTAIAGCVGIAGSTRIGRRCTIAGGAGIAGHLEIADDVHISGMGMVTNSLKEKGIYSSGTGISPHREWKRNAVRFRQLDSLANRVAALEASVAEKSKG